jgi:hypothetical protein
MEADYGLELGPTAPALEIPWEDAEGQLHYVELRSNANQSARDLELAVDGIPEARQFPALRCFLIRANSEQSAWQTAKCDAWADETNADENLYGAAFTQNCYVDIVLAGRADSLRGDLEIHKRAAQGLAQMLDAQEALEACAEIVVRRCYFHRASNLEESDAGYCLTLFLVAYGTSPVCAMECWASAMKLAAECLLKLRPCEEQAQGSELG